MKITLRSTDEFFVVDGLKTRLWEGRTSKGTDVIALIARVAFEEGAPTSEFDELQEAAPPRVFVDASTQEFIKLIAREARARRRDADEHTGTEEGRISDGIASVFEAFVDNTTSGLEQIARPGGQTRLGRLAAIAELHDLELACTCPGGTSVLVEGLFECTECGRIAVAASTELVARGEDSPPTA